MWGPDVGPPELVFLHGTAMNAHTWDTVALALDRPLVAFDLPGHGHSSWRDDSTYSPDNLAEAVAQGVERLAPQADAVVGMSLGGMTATVLAARWPELVRRLVLVDITPGVNRRKAQAIIDFVDGPQTFPSFDAILARTVEHNPTRSESSLRRGILHNAHPLPDGSWAWNYDRRGRSQPDAASLPADDEDPPPSPLWDVLAQIEVPLAPGPRRRVAGGRRRRRGRAPAPAAGRRGGGRRRCGPQRAGRPPPRAGRPHRRLRVPHVAPAGRADLGRSSRIDPPPGCRAIDP